jgi:hypothetical protein
MITYESIRGRGRVFVSLTGFSVAEFDALFSDFLRAEKEGQSLATCTRRGTPRQRAPGAGHPHALDDRTRLVMALMWLRVYPTFDVLAFLFSLHHSNAVRGVHDVLDTLSHLCAFVLDLPHESRRPLPTIEAVMDAFPDVRLIIDAKEQRVSRPKGKENQKPYYSGKNRMTTVKNQVAVAPSGFIEDIGPSVPGGENHDLTILRKSRLLDALGDGQAGMRDEGYQGIRNDYPDLALHLPHRKRQGLTEEQKKENQTLNRYRIVVEHTMAQLNTFQALAQNYRHDREGHTRTSRVVAMLVNRRVELRPLKTYQTSA